MVECPHAGQHGVAELWSMWIRRPGGWARVCYFPSERDARVFRETYYPWRRDEGRGARIRYRREWLPWLAPP